MAGGAFADWLARGRTHQFEGRPADAIPCFRRAAREEPRSPVPHFHLGEMLWQLGLAEDAFAAWRRSAALDAIFAPPRLALAEALLTQRDFAGARAVAGEAVALVPADTTAQALAATAGAAEGHEQAFAETASLIAASPGLVCGSALAGALATALDLARDSAPKTALLDSLAGLGAALPPALLAVLAESGAELPPAVLSRQWTLADGATLRRLAVAVQPGDPARADSLALAYSALAASQPPPVPLVWPVRTRGCELRIAWLGPLPASPAWQRWESIIAAATAGLSSRKCAHIVLGIGDAETTRAALATTPLAEAHVIALAAHPEGGAAKALAARDCDVLIDGAGLTATAAALLAARGARTTWAVAAGMPMHREPLVARRFDDGAALAIALHEALAAIPDDSARSAAELAITWDAAVTRHREGDLGAAASGYREILDEQPGFAPARHLLGVIAQAQGDAAGARAAFAAAVVAAPDFVEARLTGAELALQQRDPGYAVRLIRDGLARTPHVVALWRMLGLALLARRDGAAAEEAFRRALAFAPADPEAHFNHGVALQMRGEVEESARAYQRALTFDPAMTAADFNLGVLFQQAGNFDAAIAAYANVLAADPKHVTAYKNLGEVLFAAGRIDAWIANFRQFETQCPGALPMAVQALEVCQHTADFAKLGRYVDRLRKEEFSARNDAELVDALEELLYLLLFFDVPPSLPLRLAQTYDAAVLGVYGAPLPRPTARKPGPVRVGYLSADLRDHVMGKMMWQAIAHHDRAQFELYFYSMSARRDDWTRRFEGVAARFADIAALDDEAAVARIRDDDLDLLVDLATHTRGARPGILARKPARVQITHVASAGALGLSAIDFKLTDRHADLPENQAFQIEPLLAMDGCVFPFRRVAPAHEHPFHRPALGIAPDTVLIGAFVNPLKLSRRCLALWRDVLLRVPRAKLAFSPAHPAMRDSYLRLTRALEIAPERVLFLPQGRDDAENQARYRLIDFVLDTMPFGGVNGTLEALDMGVPVVTLVGKRHGERTSYSILVNLGVAQTIAHTGRDYVAIAVRLAEDAAFRADVRRAIATGLAASALSDARGHTRNLEAAYRTALSERAPEALAKG